MSILNQLQDFYKKTITQTTGAGAGKIYVSAKPTPTNGYLVISPTNAVLREIVKYTGTGTDSGGDYVTIADVADRGLGGTSAQVHNAGESIRMNMTSKHWADLITELTAKLDTSVDFPDTASLKAYIDGISLAGGAVASTITMGLIRMSYNSDVALGNCTITNASPAVITKATHGLTVNDIVQFSTTGSLPTGLTAGVKYYVLASGLTTNDFQVSLTAGGTAINTSSAGSGTHSVTKVTPIAVSPNDPMLSRLPSTGEKTAIAGKSGSAVGTLNKLIDEAMLYNGSTTDQSQATQNTALKVGEADATAKQNLIAQSFVAGKSPLKTVTLYKRANTGTFTGDVVVTIQADVSGSPSGVALATVTITNATYNALSNDATFAVNLASNLNLDIGSTYWIVVDPTTSDNSNYINLGYQNTNVYASGALKYKNVTDGWVSVTGDLYFVLTIDPSGKVPTLDSNGQLPTSVIPAGQFASYVAGESMSAGDHFFISSGQPITRAMFYQPISTQAYNAGYDIGYNGDTKRGGQTFIAKTTSIKSLNFVLNNWGTSGSITAKVVIEIRATSGGAPTGSAIWSETIPDFTIGGWSQNNVSYNIVTPPTLVVGTTYCISFEGNASSQMSVSYNSAGGVAGLSAYTFAGSTWTQQSATDLTLEMYDTITAPTEGRAYISEGFTQGEHNGVVGVCQGSVASGGSFTALVGGLVAGNSFGAGLTTISEAITESAVPGSVNNAQLYSGSNPIRQIFRTQNIANLTKLDIYAQKVNGGGGAVTVNVYDFYTQKLVATGTIADGVITTSQGWFTCTFSTPINVKANWAYYYELTSSSGNSGTNYYYIGFSTSNLYDYGFAHYNGSWQPTYDYFFRWYTTKQVGWTFDDPVYLGFGTPQLTGETLGILLGKIVNSTTYKMERDMIEQYQFMIDSAWWSNTMSSLDFKHQVPKKIRKAIVYFVGASSRININQNVQRFGLTSQYVQTYYGTTAEVNSTISFDDVNSFFRFQQSGGTAQYKVYLYS